MEWINTKEGKAYQRLFFKSLKEMQEKKSGKMIEEKRIGIEFLNKLRHFYNNGFTQINIDDIIKNNQENYKSIINNLIKHGYIKEFKTTKKDKNIGYNFKSTIVETEVTYLGIKY